MNRHFFALNPEMFIYYLKVQVPKSDKGYFGAFIMIALNLNFPTDAHRDENDGLNNSALITAFSDFECESGGYILIQRIK